MVRWKKSKRLAAQIIQEDIVEEMLREYNEDDSEYDYGIDDMNDGEHEGNYRNPMIRMAYIPVAILAVVYSAFIFIFAIFLEASVSSQKIMTENREKEKFSSGLLTPSMNKILKDSFKYRKEELFLKTCNLHLTYSTWFNSILEIIALSYSFLLLLIDKQCLYPLCQLVLYFFIRVNFVYTDIYGRFYGPADIVGALTTEVVYDLIKWSQLKVTFFELFPFTPCSLVSLLFPFFLAVFQVFANQKHSYIYESERLMRKQIRERYSRDGPMRIYRDIKL